MLVFCVTSDMIWYVLTEECLYCIGLEGVFHLEETISGCVYRYFVLSWTRMSQRHLFGNMADVTLLELIFFLPKRLFIKP